MDTWGWEREDPGGYQGAAGGHSAGTEQGVAGGGASDGVGRSPVLRPHPRRLHDRSGTAAAAAVLLLPSL